MRNKNINKVIGEGFVGLQKEVGELRKGISAVTAERDKLFDEASYFNKKLTEVTSRHCDEIDKSAKLSGRLRDAGHLVSDLRKQVAERDALLASKQAEIDALMVITATMKRLMVG